ncbi:MAG: carbohydrate kinase family protein [Candidatus Doudnabacteria bacterium]|nr:carbohydrate kinase family protein [Candidatus Doudnabacteria bacterium]
MSKYEIVSIGDTTIDAFVELHEASVHCNLDHSECQLCLTYADKIPYQELTTLPAGNSTNNAVGSARLGLKNAFVSAVGADDNGRTIIEELKAEGIDTQYIHINKQSRTNFHVVLVFKGERTILIKHNKFDYNLPAKLDTNWIYFSSMGAGTEKFHKDFGSFLKKNPSIKVSFNPGTFQMRMGTRKLGEIYEHTEVLFLNREEAALVTQQKTRDIKKLMKGMHGLGAPVSVITDGREGSYASDGKQIWFLPEFPGPRIEATGAGDAYGTAFTAAMIYGKSVEEAMIWGTINGGNVVLYVGPHKGLQTKKQMESYVKKYPKFRPKLHK